MTHTPGPWEYVQDRAIARVESRRTQAHVVGSVGPHRHGGEEEKRANARLISAAPDMLSALEDCVEALQHMKDRWGTEVNPPTLNQAKAAIAKAKGET